MSSEGLTPGERGRIADEIQRDFARVLRLIAAGDWSGAAGATTLQEIYFKGMAVPVEALLEKARGASVGRRDFGISVEEVFSSWFEADNVRLRLRLAATATRVEDGSPDGVIIDATVRFVHGRDGWTVAEFHIDCPPEPFQWNNLRHASAGERRRT
jgi:hypothetical protein